MTQKPSEYPLFKITEEQVVNNSSEPCESTSYDCRTVQHRKQPAKAVNLLNINPTTFFIFGILPPLIGAVGSISISLIYHNNLISNYNWLCGRARFPSLSRIINLPMERIFWQLCILFHVPIRILELVSLYHRYGRLLSVQYKHRTAYAFFRFCYLIIGLAELLTLAGLSVVGEREYPFLHVLLFYIFGFCGIGFFIANIFCHRHSFYYLNPYGRFAYRLKLFFCICYLLCVPIIITSFVLYWKACVKFAYDVFAIAEYTEVLLNICYHGCVYFDFRYKVIFALQIPQKSAN